MGKAFEEEMTERVLRHQSEPWGKKQQEADEWYDLHDNDEGITIRSLIFVGGLLIAVGMLGGITMILGIPKKLKQIIKGE